MIRIVLPGEPRGKGRPRFSRGKNNQPVTYTDDKTRSYEGALRWTAAAEMRGRAPLTGPLAVAVTARLPIPKSFSRKKHADAAAGLILPIVKPDFDNIAKVLDALNKVVWIDDAQVARFRIDKLYCDIPSLEITVEELTSCF